MDNKTQDFIDYIIGTRSDFCIVTETFLTNLSTVTRAALQPQGYLFVDQPRPSGDARGGTGLLHRDCFKARKTSFGQKSSFEYSEYLITWSNKRVKLSIVYHQPYSKSHPVSNSTFLEEFDEYLDTIVLCNESLIIAGDFNIHMNKPKDTYQIRLSEILRSYGLINHVHIPTHVHGNTLDLIITRDNEELLFSPPTGGYFISDHCFIHTKLAFPRPNFTVKSVTYRNIKDIDLGLFKSDLAETVSGLLPITDMEYLATQYNIRFSECLDKHAPLSTKTSVMRPKVPWYTDSLKNLKRERRKVERIWRKSKSETDEYQFKLAKNKYSFMLTKAHKEHYESEILGASGNQRKLFSIIQELSSTKKDSPLPDHDSIQQLANSFGEFFINKIQDIRDQIDIQPCVFQPPPVTQNPKDIFSSFSPLSEAEVKRLIFKSKSTSCALDPIPTELLKECVAVILPLLTKMVNLSLQTGTFPDEWKLALVVPLIKKFGLELILSNFRPVSNLSFVSNAHGFADDHQLYLSFCPNTTLSQENAVSRMETCLDSVKQWMLANKLKMNDGKTEFLIIGSQQQLDKIGFNSIRVGDSIVQCVDSVRDLGAYLDSTMCMEPHIDAKCGAAFRQLYSIRKIRKFLTRDATQTLIHAFIFSHLDYCNDLLYDLPDYQIAKLQRIQNMAARLVFRLPKFSHVTQLRIDLHWLPVFYRIRFKILLYAFKAIHGLAPKYICDMFTPYSSQYSLRRNSVIDDIQYSFGDIAQPIHQQPVFYLKVPKTKRVTFEHRSLAIAGPTEWNKLPIQLRSIAELDVFKKQLKTYLFKLAYN